MLKDIWVDSNWHFQDLATCLPPDLQFKFRSIFISEEAEDLVIWSAAHDGMYSARAGYKWLRSLSQPIGASDESWTWIWKLPISKNMKHFVWLAFHGNLPTNSLRVSRHMSSTAVCPICGAGNETLMHALRGCSRASRVWDCLDLHLQALFQSSDQKIWLKLNSTSSYGVIFLAACWAIWKARNEEVFSGKKWHGWYCVNFIHCQVSLISQSFGSKTVQSSNRLVSWNPPWMV